MVALFLSTFILANYALVVRYAQGRKCNLWAVGWIGYAVAMLVNALRQAIGGGFVPSSSTWIIGVLGGFVFATNFSFTLPLTRLRGVSITGIVFRLALLIPVVASIVLWGERPQGLQALGVVLTLCSLPLLAFKPSKIGSRLDTRGVLLLVATFIFTGLCKLTMKVFQQQGTGGETSLFLLLLYGTAGLIAFVVWLFHRQGSLRRDILPGILLGLSSGLGNIAMVAVLEQLPGVLVFPFQGAVGMIYVVLFARLVWGERITRTEAAGMALALVAVVLINLG